MLNDKNDKNVNSKIELNLPPMNIPDSPFSRAKRGKKRRLSPEQPLPLELEVLQDQSRAASPFEELEEESGSIDIAAVPVLVAAPPILPIPQMTSIPQIAQPAPSMAMALPPQILPPTVAVMANPNLSNAPILSNPPIPFCPPCQISDAIAITSSNSNSNNSSSLPPSIAPAIANSNSG